MADRIFRPGNGTTRVGCDVCQQFTYISDDEHGIVVPKQLVEQCLGELNFHDEARTIELRRELRELLK